MTTPTEKLYAFLSVTWGMVADVDIESEKYRCMGESRFLIGTIARIVGLRSYRGRLSFLPAQHTADGEKNLAYDCSPDEESRGSAVGNHVNSFIPENEFLHGSEIKANAVHKECRTAMPSSHTQGPTDHLLPPLSSELPSNWVVEEGEFILGCPLFLSHLATDLMANPDGKFGDGAMGIFFVKSGTGRLSLLNLFGKMKDGSHVLSHHVHYVRASAFRLEPDTSQSGTIAVDGEKIDYVPVQGQVHRSLAKLMCVAPPQK